MAAGSDWNCFLGALGRLPRIYGVCEDGTKNY